MGRPDDPAGPQFTWCSSYRGSHMRIDSLVSGGGGQQLRIARLWEDVPSGAGDERDGDWRLRGRPVIGAGDEPCSYCGRALDDPIDGMMGMNAPIQVPCNRGGRAHNICTLERTDRIALGYAKPRPCPLCQSEWPLGRRPPHPAELAREIPGAQKDAYGRWSRTFDALRLSTIAGRGPTQLDRPSTKAPVHTTRSRTCCEPRGTVKEHRSSRVPCIVIP